MAANDPGRCTGQCRMAQATIINRPGNITIMASTTEFSLDNFIHGDIICPGPHLETELCMADPALKANSVKPVREYNRPLSFLFSPLIKNDISIF